MSLSRRYVVAAVAAVLGVSVTSFLPAFLLTARASADQVAQRPSGTAAQIRFHDPLSPVGAQLNGVITGGSGLTIAPGATQSALIPFVEGTYVGAWRHLTAPVGAVAASVGATIPPATAVTVEARLRSGSSTSVWMTVGGQGSHFQLAGDEIQLRVTLQRTDAGSSSTPTVTGVDITATEATGPVPGVATPSIATSLTFRVDATDEGLVGHTTANGHVIVPNDHFVALPSPSVLNPQNETTYSVQVCNPGTGRCETAPVWDVGPWNIHDDYWDSPRAEFQNLPQGEPEAQAAFSTGYNGDKSDIGLTVTNPSGIDLADGVANDIGLASQGFVTVSYLWTPPPPTVSLQEFVADHLSGRVWNEYNESVSSAGPRIVGRPGIALFGASNFHVYEEQGNGDLEELTNDGLFGRLWNSYDTTAASGGPPIRDSPAVTTLSGLIQVWVPQTNGDLEEFTNDGLGGRTWNAYDITAASGGPGVWGAPAVAIQGNAVHVYDENSSGNLEEFVNTGAPGATWKANDISAASGGPPTWGAPSVTTLGGLIQVWTREWNGHLDEFTDDSLGGRTWNAYDLTAASGGPGVQGRSAVTTLGGVVHIYIQQANGDLQEFVSDGLGGRTWNAYDTTAASGGPPVGGSPSLTLLGGLIQIWARQANGDLQEYTDDHLAGRVWSSYDLTASSGGTSIFYDPAAIIWADTVAVFVGGG